MSPEEKQKIIWETFESYHDEDNLGLPYQEIDREESVYKTEPNIIQIDKYIEVDGDHFKLSFLKDSHGEIDRPKVARVYRVKKVISTFISEPPETEKPYEDGEEWDVLLALRHKPSGLLKAQHQRSIPELKDWKRETGAYKMDEMVDKLFKIVKEDN